MYSLGNQCEGLILIRPGGDRFIIIGQGLQFLEGCAGIVAGAQEDGDDTRLSCLVTLHGTLDFGPVAVLGSEVVGTDEQEDDMGGVELVHAFPGCLGASSNEMTVPAGDQSLSSQHGEVLVQDVA